MTDINAIHIPSPCQQKWQNMTEATGGRHCQTCCKTVTDFTTMSNQQIIDTLTGNSHVCGRFSPTQLTGINHQLAVQKLSMAGWWKRAAIAAAVLWTIPSCKNPVLGEPLIVQHPVKPGINKQPAIADTITYRKITGKITAAEDGLPLPGVTVMLKGANIATQTNVDGTFALNIPSTATLLTISFIGYEAQIVTINHQVGQPYNLALKSQTAMLGEVVIIRHSFFKRAYYRFVYGPHRRLRMNMKKLFANI